MTAEYLTTLGITSLATIPRQFELQIRIVKQWRGALQRTSLKANNKTESLLISVAIAAMRWSYYSHYYRRMMPHDAIDIAVLIKHTHTHTLAQWASSNESERDIFNEGIRQRRCSPAKNSFLLLMARSPRDP